MYLSHTAESALNFHGFQQEVVEVVLALVVHGVGEAELSTLLPHQEEPRRVRQESVGKRLALERNSLNNCYSAKNERTTLCFKTITTKDVSSAPRGGGENEERCLAHSLSMLGSALYSDWKPFLLQGAHLPSLLSPNLFTDIAVLK